jgi:hypothetical protein
MLGLGKFCRPYMTGCSNLKDISMSWGTCGLPDTPDPAQILAGFLEKKSAGNSSVIGTAACPGKVGRNGEGPQQR